METKKLKARGKTLLKISGLLMIIAGGISIIFAIIVLVLIGVLVNLIEETYFATAAFSGIAVIAAVVVIIGSALQIVTGIVGMKNAGIPEHYKRCKVWGIIVLVIDGLGIVLDLVGAIIFAIAISEIGLTGVSYPWYSVIVSVICGVIVPIIFIVGAGLNKQSFLEGVTSKDLPLSKSQRKKAQKIAEQLKVDDALKVKKAFEETDKNETVKDSFENPNTGEGNFGTNLNVSTEITNLDVTPVKSQEMVEQVKTDDNHFTNNFNE